MPTTVTRWPAVVQHHREVVGHPLDPAQLLDVVGDQEHVPGLVGRVHDTGPRTKNSSTTCLGRMPGLVGAEPLAERGVPLPVAVDIVDRPAQRPRRVRPWSPPSARARRPAGRSTCRARRGRSPRSRRCRTPSAAGVREVEHHRGVVGDQHVGQQHQLGDVVVPRDVGRERSRARRELVDVEVVRAQQQVEVARRARRRIGSRSNGSVVRRAEPPGPVAERRAVEHQPTVGRQAQRRFFASTQSSSTPRTSRSLRGSPCAPACPRSRRTSRRSRRSTRWARAGRSTASSSPGAAGAPRRRPRSSAGESKPIRFSGVPCQVWTYVVSRRRVERPRETLVVHPELGPGQQS